MSDVLVEASQLCKYYPLVAQRSDRLRALLAICMGQVPNKPVRVLDNISVSVSRGQSLAIIGRNGAGKSTLLKLITGVLSASSGHVITRGSIGALLELGAGFHPEYSGRDNVRMAAALYGLQGQALQQALPQIEAFADIGRYFDEPVKHYSTGMTVRLGFSVIAAVRPDVLITDEVLAVGDESFQRKCIQWIDDYLSQGGTLILVSHSMYHVQKICKHAMWLNDGRIEAYGDVFEVTQRYLAWHAQREAEQTTPVSLDGLDHRVTRLSADGFADAGIIQMTFGAALTLRIELASSIDQIPHVLVGIARADGTPIYGVSTEMDQVQCHIDGAGKYHTILQFPALPLLPGAYKVKAHAMDPQALRLFDTVERELQITGTSREFGSVHIEHQWNALR